jgi:ribosomal protein S18 acetylase RimI-like enzyme
LDSYSIRPVAEADTPFLREMLYESLYVPEGQQPFNRNIINEPFLSKYVEGWGKEGDMGFIAVNSIGLSVGSITARLFTEDNKGFGYVRHDIPELGLAVKAEYRGRGIGAALIKTFIDEMKEKGIKGVSLSVDPGNLGAVRLYQRFGFKEVGMVGTSITMVTYL